MAHLTSNRLIRPRRSAPRCWSPLVELRNTWLFVYRDLSASLIPAGLFALSACRYHHAPADRTLVILGKATIWLFLYIYIFCLSNQITGLEEDRRNKPYRPLVRGSATIRGTWTRWAAAMLCFSVLGWWLHVLAFTLLWQLLTVLHNFAGWGAWGFTKNLVMVLGAISELGTAWSLTGPLNATGWRWITVISITLGALGVHMQDLRDLEGDRSTGRRTLPIIFGETATRRYLSALMTALPIVFLATLYEPEGLTTGTITATLLLTAICWTVSIRVLTRPTARSDHKTYMLYTYVYCTVLASGIMVF